jgi:hypothetical protein
MFFTRRSHRRETQQSFDFSTTVHYSCRHCHHWANASRVQLHISRDGSQENRIRCSRCGREYFSMGGIKPRLSLMSQLTTNEEPVQSLHFLTPAYGPREDASHTSSFFSRLVSTILPSSVSGNMSTTDHRHESSTRDNSTGVSQTEAHEAIEPGTHMSGARASSLPLSQCPETLGIDEAPASIRTPRRRLVSATLSKWRKKSRRVADRAKGLLVRTRKRLIRRPSIPKTPQKARRESQVHPGQAASSTNPQMEVSSATSPRRISRNIPEECMFCETCQQRNTEIRTQLTEESKQRAADECPRDCCKLLRKHGLRDATIVVVPGEEDPVSHTVYQENGIPEGATVFPHLERPNTQHANSDNDVLRAGDWQLDSRRPSVRPSSLSLSTDSQGTTHIEDHGDDIAPPELGATRYERF